MRAVKLVGPGAMELQDVPVPQIGADDVLVKVAGAGLCHSDLHVLHMGEEWPFFGGTVGHEGAGWVEKAGAAVGGLTKGDAVLVSVIWACGRCRACVEGRDNACMDTNAEQLPWGVNIQRSFGGTRADQLQVIALAQQGKLTVETVTYPLAEFRRAWLRMSTRSEARSPMSGSRSQGYFRVTVPFGAVITRPRAGIASSGWTRSTWR